MLKLLPRVERRRSLDKSAEAVIMMGSASALPVIMKAATLRIADKDKGLQALHFADKFKTYIGKLYLSLLA